MDSKATGSKGMGEEGTIRTRVDKGIDSPAQAVNLQDDRQEWVASNLAIARPDERETHGVRRHPVSRRHRKRWDGDEESLVLLTCPPQSRQQATKVPVVVDNALSMYSDPLSDVGRKVLSAEPLVVLVERIKRGLAALLRHLRPKRKWPVINFVGLPSFGVGTKAWYATT